jgi:chromosome partitioning protein
VSVRYIISIANQKGGVGKTTTAVCLAAQLAINGLRTLLIDADPQGNTSQCFFEEGDVVVGLADVLNPRNGREVKLLTECAVTTELVNLDLVPTGIELATFDRQQPMEAMTALRRSIARLDVDYDFIIIDTPPNLGLLLSAALIAATHVIIPVEMGHFALVGFDDLIYALWSARALNAELKLLGIVPTRLDKRTRRATECYERLYKIVEISKNCALLNVTTEHITKSVIHETTALGDCAKIRQPIQLFAPDSRGAEEYGSLCQELLERLKINNRSFEVVTGTNG